MMHSAVYVQRAMRETTVRPIPMTVIPSIDNGGTCQVITSKYALRL